MIVEKPLKRAQTGRSRTTLTRLQILRSLKDREYRREFVAERVRSSIPLQIRALREQRNKMTQKQLAETLGKAQAWISKLEDPEYGKVTVATLLELAHAFDTDLEIKFRPFSDLLKGIPQGTEYFKVPGFDDEKLSEDEVAQWETASDDATAIESVFDRWLTTSADTPYGRTIINSNVVVMAKSEGSAPAEIYGQSGRKDDFPYPPTNSSEHWASDKIASGYLVVSKAATC